MQHNPAFLKLCEESIRNIRETSVENVHQKQERHQTFYFIDVREDHEWSLGYAKGAIHLGRGIIERDIENKIHDWNAEIVLYCGGGFRSALAAESLQKMGYTNVWSMAGGFKAWKTAGKPIEI